MYMYMYMYISIYVYVYLYIYICIYICVCISIYIYIHTYLHMCMIMYKNIGTWLAVHNLSPIVFSRYTPCGRWDAPAEPPDPSKSPTETGDERRHPKDNIWAEVVRRPDPLKSCPDGWKMVEGSSILFRLKYQVFSFVMFCVQVEGLYQQDRSYW